MSDARQSIGEALTGKLSQEQIDTLIDEVLSLKKKAFATFSCKECGKKQRQEYEVADVVAVTSALEKLMNQSWGRPNETEPEKAGVTLVRQVFSPEGAMLATGWGEPDAGG